MWAAVGMQKMKPTSVSRGVVRVLSRRDRGEKQRLLSTTLCTPQNGWIILLAVCPLWWEVSLIHTTYAWFCVHSVQAQELRPQRMHTHNRPITRQDHGEYLERKDGEARWWWSASANKLRKKQQNTRQNKHTHTHTREKDTAVNELHIPGRGCRAVPSPRRRGTPRAQASSC